MTTTEQNLYCSVFKLFIIVIGNDSQQNCKKHLWGELFPIHNYFCSIYFWKWNQRLKGCARICGLWNESDNLPSELYEFWSPLQADASAYYFTYSLTLTTEKGSFNLSYQIIIIYSIEIFYSWWNSIFTILRILRISSFVTCQLLDSNTFKMFRCLSFSYWFLLMLYILNVLLHIPLNFSILIIWTLTRLFS